MKRWLVARNSRAGVYASKQVFCPLPPTPTPPLGARSDPAAIPPARSDLRGAQRGPGAGAGRPAARARQRAGADRSAPG